MSKVGKTYSGLINQKMLSGHNTYNYIKPNFPQMCGILQCKSCKRDRNIFFMYTIFDSEKILQNFPLNELNIALCQRFFGSTNISIRSLVCPAIPVYLIFLFSFFSLCLSGAAEFFVQNRTKRIFCPGTPEHFELRPGSWKFLNLYGFRN